MASRLLPSPKCIVFVALLHILLPLLCRHLPFSFYFHFDPSSAGDENSEEERAFDQLAIIARSKKKLANIARSEGKPAKIAREGEQQHSSLAVLVLTAKRRGVSYLGRSLLALHKEVRRDGVDQQHLVFVCTGEEALGLRELPFPFLQPNNSLPYLPPGDQKAKRDLVFCSNQLEKMLPKSVEHILILEEDAVLMEDFFSTLLAWMSFHSERLQSEPWLDIKLYLNPRLRGWAWDPLPLVELLASTSLLTWISHNILTRLQVSGSRSESWLSLVFLWLAILAALLLVGRQHWLQWRRLHPQFYLRRDAPNAGTPAVLYPRQRLRGAIGYVEQKIDTPTPFDLVLGKYRQNQGLVGHLLEPNLVRHIGVSSVFDAAHESDRDGRDKREFQLKYPV